MLFLGGFIQSSAGFGFGLFALPLLLFLKLKLFEAVLLVIIGSALQKVIGIGYFRKVINLREISPLIISGLSGLPLGIFLMFKVSGLNQDIVKQVIGFLIFFILILRWMKVVKPVSSVKSFWTKIAGFISGILNGFANIGGPPVVLWVLAQKWENRKMRATIITFSLFFVPFQIFGMILIYGNKLSNIILTAIILSPFVVIGSFAGLKFGDLFSNKVLERIMEILLLTIAMLSVIKPLFN